MAQYIKPNNLWLKDHPEYNEKWLQKRIAEDPSLLGLGDLVLRDQERPQPFAGRLDLLLQDPDTDDRYEVELQLGATDESHIIRTIEYWDIERKRYPQYDHTAVIVAEDITSRFLNVINLFNGSIPLIAIQFQAVQFGEFVSLVFTTVLDRNDRGLVGEDEEIREVADRAYWEQRATKDTMMITDDVLRQAQLLDPQLGLKYNKYYVGISRDGDFFNFVSVSPKKKFARLNVRIPSEPQLDEKLEQSGLEYEYDKRNNRYRIKLTHDQFKTNVDLLDQIIKDAYAKYVGA
jgi:hypothetical protein